MDVRLVFLIEGNSKVLQRHIKIVELGLHVSLWEYKFRDFLGLQWPLPTFRRPYYLGEKTY